MPTTKKHKKNLIVSYKNLTDDLKEKFKEAYPEGYNNYLQKFVKPNGEAIYVVPFETTDTAYMVKFEVKIDTLGEDLDKALFDDDEVEGKEDEFAPLSEALEKEEENTSHREKVLKHGSYDDILEEEEGRKKKLTLGINKEEFKEAFGDEENADEMDSYERLDDDEPSDDDFEPSDDDIRGIEEEFLDAEIPPLDATIPEEEAVPLKSKGSKKLVKKAESKPATKTTSKTVAKKNTKKTTTKTTKAPSKAVKATTKPASKPATKTAIKPTAKPAAKPATKPTTKTAAKPSTKTAVKPAAKKTASTKKKK